MAQRRFRKALGETAPIVSCRNSSLAPVMPSCRRKAAEGKNRSTCSSLMAICPCLRAETLQKLVETQKANPGPMTMLTVIARQPARVWARSSASRMAPWRQSSRKYVATPEQLADQGTQRGRVLFQRRLAVGGPAPHPDFAQRRVLPDRYGGTGRRRTTCRCRPS